MVEIQRNASCVNIAISQNGAEALIITYSVVVGVYVLFLAWAVLNIKLFLWDQRRYRNFGILIFYVLTVIIVFCRILMWINGIVVQMGSHSSFWQYPYVYDFCYVVTMFLILIIGFL
jgi:hypothetical protein